MRKINFTTTYVISSFFFVFLFNLIEYNKENLFSCFLQGYNYLCKLISKELKYHKSNMYVCESYSNNFFTRFFLTSCIFFFFFTNRLVIFFLNRLSVFFSSASNLFIAFDLRPEVVFHFGYWKLKFTSKIFILSRNVVKFCRNDGAKMKNVWKV